MHFINNKFPYFYTTARIRKSFEYIFLLLSKGLSLKIWINCLLFLVEIQISRIIYTRIQPLIQGYDCEKSNGLHIQAWNLELATEWLSEVYTNLPLLLRKSFLIIMLGFLNFFYLEKTDFLMINCVFSIFFRIGLPSQWHEWSKITPISKNEILIENQN